jgi:hypothetical protein
MEYTPTVIVKRLNGESSSNIFPGSALTLFLQLFGKALSS